MISHEQQPAPVKADVATTSKTEFTPTDAFETAMSAILFCLDKTVDNDDSSLDFLSVEAALLACTDPSIEDVCKMMDSERVIAICSKSSSSLVYAHLVGYLAGLLHQCLKVEEVPPSEVLFEDAEILQSLGTRPKATSVHGRKRPTRRKL